jgi:hypothetical protein
VSRLSHLVNIEPRPDKRKQVFSDPDKRKYDVHRTNARMRGIEFKLTFEEWFCWWMDTGHYSERGNKRGQYVMARKGDQGPYALGNIECLQAQVNSVAPHAGKPKSEAWKAAFRKTQSERPWSTKRKKELTERSAENQD